MVSKSISRRRSRLPADSLHFLNIVVIRSVAEEPQPDGETKASINYDRLKEDALWDGLKGYITNTELPTDQIYTSYHNLWNVEKAFRIAKLKIEIRPMVHFTRRRIEAHICICFVALKVYKELERRLKCSDIKMSVDKVLAMAQTINYY
jgi:transposase